MEEASEAKEKTSKKRNWRCIMAWVLGSLVSVFLLVMFNQQKLMFYPPEWKGDTKDLVQFASGENTLRGYFVPPKDEGQPVVLYSHGNAEDLSSVRKKADRISKLGWGILAYDYAGYGASTGKPSEQTVYRNVESAYEYLTQKKGFPPARILVMGYSIGGGPSCYIAEQKPVAGLMLEAPFATTASAVLRFRLPVDHFPNIDRIGKVNCPVFIIHGERDGIVPVVNGKRLYKAAKEPKKLILLPEANHGTILEEMGEDYEATCREFAAACGWGK